jgi:NDP-sugar pyrophosphorylase family protein
MKLAIMQPYLFPYIGYFQLIHAADLFVLYDDVNFRKQSWINRNKILLNGKDYTFTIPCRGVSSNKLINAVILKNKKIKTFAHNGYWLDIGQHEDYKKAQHDVKTLKL